MTVLFYLRSINGIP